MVMVAAAAPAGPTTLRLAVNVSGAVNRRDSPRRCCGAETDKAVNASVMTSGNQDMDESPRETDENASRRGYPTERGNAHARRERMVRRRFAPSRLALWPNRCRGPAA